MRGGVRGRGSNPSTYSILVNNPLVAKNLIFFFEIDYLLIFNDTTSKQTGGRMTAFYTHHIIAKLLLINPNTLSVFPYTLAGIIFHYKSGCCFNKNNYDPAFVRYGYTANELRTCGNWVKEIKYLMNKANHFVKFKFSTKSNRRNNNADYFCMMLIDK